MTEIPGTFEVFFQRQHDSKKCPRQIVSCGSTVAAMASAVVQGRCKHERGHGVTGPYCYSNMDFEVAQLENRCFLTVGACENGLVFHRLWHEHGYFPCARVSLVSDVGLYVLVCGVTGPRNRCQGHAQRSWVWCAPATRTFFTTTGVPSSDIALPGRGKHPNM